MAFVVPTAAQRAACDGFMLTARQEEVRGVLEASGEADNARVLEYLRTVFVKRSRFLRDSTPWCSAFANWCVLQSNLAGTGKPNARSWLQWGEAIAEPIPGCIVIFSRPPLPWSGHVGFYVRTAIGGRVITLGGNQNDRVGEKTYPLARVLGYRVPSRAVLTEELTS